MKRQTLLASMISVLFMCNYTIGFSQTVVLDNTFGQNGIVLLNSNANTPKLLIEPSGKIILAGEELFSNFEKVIVIRLNDNGNLDNSFGSLGTTTIDVNQGNGEGVAVNGITYLTNGEILISGENGDNCNISNYTKKFFLSRLTNSGVLDNTFGLNGNIQNTHNQLYETRGGYMINDNIGNVYLAGRIYECNISNNCIINSEINECAPIFSKVNENGVIDISYNIDSTAFFFWTLRNYPAYSFVKYNDTSYLFSSVSIVDKQFPTDSVREHVFMISPSKDGMRTTDVYSTSEYENSKIFDLLAVKDNMIYMGGNKLIGGNNHFLIKRVSDTGMGFGSMKTDSTFGTNGTVTINLTPNGECALKAMAVQNDGKVILAGYAKTSTLNTFDFKLIRLNTDGTFDNSFGNNGVLTADLNGEDFLEDIKLDDDKIIVTGVCYGNQSQKIAVLRYNNDSSTAIEDLNTLSFGLYPNPHTQTFTISVTSDLLHGKIELCHLLGGVALSSTIESINIEISTDQIPKGVYIATITAPDGRKASRKVVSF